MPADSPPTLPASEANPQACIDDDLPHTSGRVAASMRVVVTGSEGSVGSCLVRALLSRGDEPIEIDLHSRRSTSSMLTPSPRRSQAPRESSTSPQSLAWHGANAIPKGWVPPDPVLRSEARSGFASLGLRPWARLETEDGRSVERRPEHGFGRELQELGAEFHVARQSARAIRIRAGETSGWPARSRRKRVYRAPHSLWGLRHARSGLAVPGQRLRYQLHRLGRGNRKSKLEILLRPALQPPAI